jgi:hypothetical protein
MALVMSIEPDPVTGCRDGSGVFSQNPDGYCTTGVEGRTRSVTRLVVSQTQGRPISPHPEENYADRNAKGRQARGESSGRSRLTEADVREIRSSYRPTTIEAPTNRLELARSFGVSPQTIDKIVSRRSWVHVQ